MRPTLFISLLLILITGIALRIANLDNVTRRSPDEKLYTEQAKFILLRGNNGIRALIQEYNLDKKWWIYPPPIRLGYLWLLAGAMKILNNESVKVGAYISCTFSILSLLLLVLMGLRFFNSLTTLYAALFLSISPMDLAIARRTWQDAILGFMGLLLIYFCCEIMRNVHKKIWYILFFTVTFLSLAIATPYCQNLRYVSVPFVPFYLISGLGFCYIISRFKNILKKRPFYIVITLVFSAVFFAAARDYQNYQKIFVKTGVADISIRMLRDMSSAASSPTPTRAKSALNPNTK